MSDASNTPARPTFAGLVAAKHDALGDAKVAILGAAHGSPYEPGVASHAADGPRALRHQSQLFAGQLTQVDFDTGLVLQEHDRKGLIVDCGDLELDLSDAATNRARITQAVRSILDAGVVPVVIGGDDSVPIPVLAAYNGRGPISIVQVDAHVDWGDEIRGNRYGYGSPMRRASEMPWVRAMVQVGIRGLGSGTADQHDAARDWGSRIFTMSDLRRFGIAQVLEALPKGQDCFVTIDFDGMDPSVIPAVNMPTPGGLSYQDILELLHGVANRAPIVGATLVELVAARDDVHGVSAMTASRIALSIIGLIAKQSRAKTL
jgi:agmatinase